MFQGRFTGDWLSPCRRALEDAICSTSLACCEVNLGRDHRLPTPLPLASRRSQNVGWSMEGHQGWGLGGGLGGVSAKPKSATEGEDAKMCAEKQKHVPPNDESLISFSIWHHWHLRVWECNTTSPRNQQAGTSASLWSIKHLRSGMGKGKGKRKKGKKREEL